MSQVNPYPSREVAAWHIRTQLDSLRESYVNGTITLEAFEHELETMLTQGICDRPPAINDIQVFEAVFSDERLSQFARPQMVAIHS